MFAWIGAAVDIPHKVHKLLTTLGPKLYFLRVPNIVKKSEDNYYENIKKDDFVKKIREVSVALFDYLNWFDKCPIVIKDEGNEIPKIQWDIERNDELAQRYIIRLAILLAHLREVVPTWHTQDTQGSEYAYSLPIIEEPDRAIQQLTNLARGHALSQGRNYITKEDVPIVIKTVLSTASRERITIFDLLLAHNGRLTTSIITDSLNTTKPTALRTMTELKALGIVVMFAEGAYDEKIIELKSDFNWFLEPEFQSLREGFQPQDANEDKQNQAVYIASDNAKGDETHKEKTPPHSQNQECIPLTSASEIDGNVDTISSVDDSNPISLCGGKISLRDRRLDNNNNPIEGSHLSQESARNAGLISRTAVHSDTWKCEDCGLKGDIHFMSGHNCRYLRILGTNESGPL